MENYTLDADSKTLGRVASLAAQALRGKNQATFRRERVPERQVTVINAGKLKMSPPKRRNKVYLRYSGYPGGLKTISLEQLIQKRGIQEPIRQAVHGMLPKNKLRAILMKRLVIKE